MAEHKTPLEQLLEREYSMWKSICAGAAAEAKDTGETREEVLKRWRCPPTWNQYFAHYTGMVIPVLDETLKDFLSRQKTNI